MTFYFYFLVAILNRSLSTLQSALSAGILRFLPVTKGKLATQAIDEAIVFYKQII